MNSNELMNKADEQLLILPQEKEKSFRSGYVTELEMQVNSIIKYARESLYKYIEEYAGDIDRHFMERYLNIMDSCKYPFTGYKLPENRINER